MEATMARETILKTTIRPDGTVLCEFPGYDALVIDPNAMPENVRLLCMAYGAREKATNAAALGRDPKTGKPASVADKRQRVLDVVDAMMAGAWEVRASGTGDDAVLAQAIAEYKGMPEHEAREIVAEWDAGTKKAMMGDDELAPIVARLRKAAAARAGVDTKGLLARIG